MSHATPDPETAHLMLQQAPDALLLVDPDGRIVFTNAAVSSLFGYDPADLLGQGIEALVPERSRDVHQRLRRGFAAAPATREMGARLVTLNGRRQDGSEFPAEIRLAPLASNGRDFVLAAVRDVTERHRITDALRSARAEADSANQAKSRFLATASHDLRQPLQSLQLLNAALTRRCGDPAVLDLAHRQQSGIEAMGDLLNSLLDVTRLESGALRPKLEVVALGDVLSDLQQQFETVAATRGIALHMAAATESLRTDRVLFRQVLQNLLNNAVKFTRQGSVTLRVARTPTHLTIDVADTVVGIPAAELERIFDEYYRVQTPGIEVRGFGLGLTIVRQISRLLGITVNVSAEQGRGTTFSLLVPADQLVETIVAAGSPPQSAFLGATLAKPGVLVVEDDAAVREALEVMLGAEGYPTLVAHSAARAEALFRDRGGEIDFIVSDFHLGDGRDGVEMLEKLRAVAGRDLPAVILSGDTTPAMKALAQVPRTALLRKPVDAARLIRQIEELFGAS